MSLLDFLGAGKSISDAQAAASQIVQEAGPILDEIEERLNGIISSNLDRLDGATLTGTFSLTLNLKPIPKATAVE
jgi:hypothetical protein